MTKVPTLPAGQTWAAVDAGTIHWDGHTYGIDSAGPPSNAIAAIINPIYGAAGSRWNATKSYR